MLNKVLHNIKQSTAISMTFNTPWAEKTLCKHPKSDSPYLRRSSTSWSWRPRNPGSSSSKQQHNSNWTSFAASCDFITAQLEVIPCCHTLQTFVVIWRQWSRREPWNDIFLLLLYLWCLLQKERNKQKSIQNKTTNLRYIRLSRNRF